MEGRGGNGDGGGLPGGDSGGDAGGDPFSHPGHDLMQAGSRDGGGGGNGDGGGLPGGDSGGDAGAEPFSNPKQGLFVKMLHDSETHAFSVSLSDTTVEELELLVKQRLESKQMSWTAGNIVFVFEGASYDPRIDGHRILSELGMAKNSTTTAIVNHTAVKSDAETPAVDARTGRPRQFVSVQINSGPYVGKVLEISVSLDNTTVGGLAHLVKQEMQKMPSHGGVTTVKSFQCEEETFEPGRSHQVATKLALQVKGTPSWSHFFTMSVLDLGIPPCPSSCIHSTVTRSTRFSSHPPTHPSAM